MSQPQHAQKVIPCECGSTEPYWHGPEHGLRHYCCDVCWTRRQLATLTPDELQTVAHALDVAAQRYTENAAIMRAESTKALEHAAADSTTACGYQVQARGFDRLAAQFESQAAAARALYPRFADL